MPVLFHQEFEALDLHARSGEPIQQGAVAEFRFEKLSQENANDLLVAHHPALVFNLFRLRGRQ
jgi:hypothetical protein